MQLKQDNDDVLQYAAKFESLKAQMETYDEQMLVDAIYFRLKRGFDRTCIHAVPENGTGG